MQSFHFKIILVIALFGFSFYPLSVDAVTFENDYGKLEVYPDISRNIIRQKQYYNATSYLPSQDLDIAFRFNESLSYGRVYYYNNEQYNKVDVEHVEYNNKHWYIMKDIYFEQDETKHGYWEYDIPINSSGKWDMFIKRSSDTLQYAIDNNLFVHLDPWWNSSFQYVSGSCINNNMTNYPMLINVSNSTGGDLVIGQNHQLNWSDVRFVNQANNSELYHWIEYQCDEYAYFWVNISTEDYINCYRGANVSISNSTYNNEYKIFLFFDHFNDLTNWSDVDDGSVFTTSGGYLRIEDGAASDMYIDFNDETTERFIRTRGNLSDGTGQDNFHVIGLYQAFDGDNWDFDNNEFFIGFYDDYPVNAKIDIRHKDNFGTTCSYFGSPIIDKFYRMQIGYDKRVLVVEDNFEGKISENTACGLNNIPDILQVKNRLGNTYVTYWDWVAVGLYNSTTEPSFCSWTSEIYYCDTLVSLSNPSPVENYVVNCLNLSYLTINATFLYGSADSLNISIYNETSLYYINYTSNVVNGSYSLDVIFHNYSYDTTYEWWVNISIGDCNINENYTFICQADCGCYDELQSITYKANRVLDDMIKEDDELDINLGIVLLATVIGLVLLALSVLSDYLLVGATVGYAGAFAMLYFIATQPISYHIIFFCIMICCLVVAVFKTWSAVSSDYAIKQK